MDELLQTHKFLILCILGVILLISASCEQDKSDVIFSAQKICSKNGTYCHTIITDSQEANLTFEVDNSSQPFTYKVDV